MAPVTIYKQLQVKRLSERPASQSHGTAVLSYTSCRCQNACTM